MDKTLEKSTKPIKHPSWRVYKAIQDCKLDVKTFGLKDVPIHFPYLNNDELTDELCQALQNPDYDNVVYEIRDCLDLFQNQVARQLIEILLLNKKPVSEISDNIGSTESFVITYKALFFDTTVFKTDIEKLIYIREGTVGEDARAKRELEEKGEEYLKIKYGVDPNKVNIDTLLADVMVKSYKAMLKTVDMDDIGAQQVAQGWVNVLVKLASQLNKKGSGNFNIEDLVIQLNTTPPPTKSIDELERGE